MACPGAFEILDLNLADVAALAPVLAEMHRACFDPGWDAGSFVGTLSMPGVFGAVAVQDPGGALMGFAVLRAGGGEAEVLTIATHPGTRGKGAARGLMDRALKVSQTLDVQTVFLEVAADNTPALALYRSLGFCQTGRRRGYYARPGGAREDALVMALTPSPLGLAQAPLPG